MKRDQLSFINPNRLYGCHPLDLRGYFEDSQFIHDIGKNFPLATTQKDISTPPISTKRRATKRRGLEHILDKISRSDLPCKAFFTDYLRHKYRKNCGPNTLRIVDISLMQFLSFYRDKQNSI